ncbi:MAG: hypothetical protein C0594_08120 [Marinilabiliales bacterium]|nr:MAG: hypothetical protein C0594_08120 [Marinilabiliales bacterium]
MKRNIKIKKIYKKPEVKTIWVDKDINFFMASTSPSDPSWKNSPDDDSPPVDDNPFASPFK